ncbi:hypothetical protein GCM10020001_076880 [Nonomuraea salmonea]
MPPARLAPFGGEEHGSAPFAADADALEQAQQREQDAAPDADLLVRGHEPDEGGGHAHGDEGGDERGLAADAVAVVAEDGGADGPGGEPAEVGAEGEQESCGGVAGGEEELREQRAGGEAVEEEVVPLDRGADGGGDHRTDQLPSSQLT